MKQLQVYLQSILPYLLVFIATLYRPIDPDLGWHLRYGEYFFTHGQVLRENIHAAEMVGFQWANIAWGADLFYYLAYHWGGFLGLTLLSSLIICLTFFFFAKAFKLDYWEQAIVFPIILFFENPVHVNSFRGQLFSMLLLGVLLFVLKRYDEYRGKWLYAIPLVFLLWANLHGLFLLGLGLFILWEASFLLSQALPERSFNHVLPFIKPFLLVTLVSIAATLIHPFGLGIYYDALIHVNNPLLKAVAEYGAAAELTQQWYHLFFIALFTGIGITALVVKRQLYKNFPYITIFSALYVLSLNIKRYSWPMFYLSIPFIQPFAKYFRPDTKKGLWRGATSLFLLYIVIMLLLKLPLAQYQTYNWDDYCKQLLHCSSKAAKTLRTYYKPGKTMTPYSWGGWMIWNYPDMKPSTDGRMHLWKDEKGYSAFDHDHTLEYVKKDIDTSKYDVVLAPKTKPIYNHMLTLLQRDTWQQVYEDTSSGIFIRK